MSTTNTSELRDAIAETLRTGHHGIAETKVINGFLLLIESYTQAARLDEVNRLRHGIAWQTVHCKPHAKNGLNIAMDVIDDRDDALKSTISGEGV